MLEEPARLLHPSSSPDPDLAALRRIAESLAGGARDWPGMADPRRRTWDLITASEAFEAWVIAWPPGGAIELHDHGASAGAVAVASGTLTEHAVSHHGGNVAGVARTKVRAGSAITFGPWHVHDVVNLDDRPALSVHVYSPRLQVMHYFHMDAGRLVRARVVHSPIDADVA